MKYMKLGSKPDAFQSDGNNIRFVATELATDIVVNVGDVKFHLHKFPLLSKSPRLQKLVVATGEEEDEEIDIPDIPGGPAAFEICAKFCYGMIVTLNAYNAVAARCAAEYLEMHEAVEKGNLIYKIEVFLSSSILRAWKDSIIVLHTTRSLLPWAEDLKLVVRCTDSIASKASVDPSEVDWSYTYNRKKLPSENGLDPHWNGVRKQQSVPKDWWVEDLCDLEMDSYKRVLIAIRTKGKIADDVVGEALKAYAYRRLPGFAKGSVTCGSDPMRSRTILETIVWLLPTEPGSVSCSFLLKLLRSASALECGETCKKELIRRAGRQLQEAAASDLLLPSATGETVYDVDLVASVVEEFVTQDGGTARTSPEASEEVVEVRSPVFVSPSSKAAVANLVYEYLAEVAKDPDLPLPKFVELAEMVSAASTPVHDGLYRAIDVYLKEHPGLSKSEKRRICSMMDCRKLSTDACVHAVQNERLPLRVVVQILFFVQMRAAAAPAAGGVSQLPGNVKALLRENGGSYGSSRSAVTTNTEDDWDGVPTAGGDINSLKSAGPVGRGGGSQRSSGGSDVSKHGDEKGNGKVKGILLPKRILSKLWSGKGQGGENSSSDMSESPGSVAQEEAKSTHSRNTRHSVS
ncbi:unnamed protein product [Musa acuminata subsp. malaccensis]|uniref:(wild Malaysian banana) hypothetical protein n=1 Tax=Musa acuminata subsp. malaccensis TaxID=214687 RepID=A0A804IZR0_MUSAM|nr:PREDICTED: BTB/POZ domain-containing protein NPY3-like [Musa acuminata subsp. malaccensis]XP_009399111.1 PREDICTED: BTB/POZ domain-containing protein NPY3-like [Musa acuminata subsp. malaccensis]CAG1837211.1 unnamed protein product [Musa acuminata subsp. malaccensis]